MRRIKVVEYQQPLFMMENKRVIMKKIYMLSFLLLFAAGGCTLKSDKINSEMKLNAGQGEVISISLADAIKKKENKEEFLLMFTQTYCSYCLDFFMETDSFTKEIGVIIYDVVLDDETESQKNILSTIQENFDDFSSTPSLYYVADGKIRGSLLSSDTKVNLASYKQWLKEMQIIE